MAALKITIDDVAAAVKESILSMDAPVRAACTIAIKIAGRNLLSFGQSDISRAGLGAKFTGAWHVKFFPEGRQSINAAVWAYHKIPWAGIFEDGGTIHGKPMLWIPLRNAPRFVARGHVTPRKLIAKGIKLFPIVRAGKPPLLATKVLASAQSARNRNILKTNVTLRSLLRPRALHKPIRVTVPLFFGIQAVTIRKKLHIGAIAQTERDSLAGYYVANLQVE